MSEPAPFARIPLARSPLQLLALPLAAIAAGLLAAMAGLALLSGTGGVLLALAGGLAAALGLALAVVLLSIRIDAVNDGLRVSSVVGSRHHVLSSGPVTRLAISGPDAVPLRSVLGGRAWAYGRARLRDRERIWVVRLAVVDALVVIPTDLGRLAVAPRSEGALLESLAEIGRTSQRPQLEAGSPAGPEATMAPGAIPAVPDPVPRLLTGIERSIVWDLLEVVRIEEEAAAERAALEEEARRAVGELVRQAAPAAPETTPRAARGEGRRWSLRRRGTAVDATRDEPVVAVRPGEVELHAPVAIMAAAPVTAVVIVEPPAVVAAPARRGRRSRPKRSRLRRRIDRFLSLPPARRLASIGLIALPVAIVVGGWFGADRLGTLPESIVGLRSVALAMLLIGPATALAAIIARAAAPRLVGLVVMSAMVAIVITARALMP